MACISWTSWCSVVAIYNSDMEFHLTTSSSVGPFRNEFTTQWPLVSFSPCYPTASMSISKIEENRGQRMVVHRHNLIGTKHRIEIFTQLTSKMQFILFNNTKSAILSSAEATVKENMFWLLCDEILHTYVILDEVRTRF